MSGLTTSQIIATAYIAGGGMKSGAAKKVGVSPQTISSWMQDEGFQAAIEDFRRTIIYSTRDKLRALGTKATDTLYELMESGNDGAKLGAAKLVLETINLTPGTNGQEMGLWDTASNDSTSLFLPTNESMNEFLEEN